MNYNQKYEPKGNRVIHGAGQSPEAFSKYWKAVEDYKPAIYMTYAKIQKIEHWINKIKIELKDYPNIMLQIGFKLLAEGDGDITPEILEGKYDKEIDDFLNTVKELKNPTFLRIGYEFDKKGKYNPKSFVKAWKYVVEKIRKAKIENIATVWCACPFNGTDPVEQFYPGDDYVDWFGIDVFFARHITGKYKPVEDFLKLAKKHKKPVMVGESTAAGVGVIDGEKSWKDWFEPYFKWIHDHKHIKAFCYINWDWIKDKTWGSPGTWGNCRIEENEIVRKKFVKELSNPVYVHNS
ncbi:hypothetical protein HOA55_04935 [archaeon]|jgi:hypothetical protein|nr:hypothetical protein [archaeon]MBT3578125.1 hypothetical protein [archaeon]MBT6820673.1 hypothetical protein [archaeon]MBT7024917.1 hypothetical protein [archaeon]MBT7238536.1 hypothetical protein [archaeon]